MAVASALATQLEGHARVQVWNTSTFEPGSFTLEALLLQLSRSDLAVFVLSPDDLTASRGVSQRSPRDNVIFEAGLFLGRLGRARTFLLFDTTQKPKLPTDILGLTLLTY